MQRRVDDRRRDTTTMAWDNTATMRELSRQPANRLCFECGQQARGNDGHGSSSVGALREAVNRTRRNAALDAASAVQCKVPVSHSSPTAGDDVTWHVVHTQNTLYACMDIGSYVCVGCSGHLYVLG